MSLQGLKNNCKKVILSIPTKLKQAPKDFEKKIYFKECHHNHIFI